MNGIYRVYLVYALLLSIILGGCVSAQRGEVTSAQGANGVVVASHPIAAAIGLDVLLAGGNAVDAAVATGLALGVVDQFNSGIGGGGFIVIRMADGAIYAIDGREAAPAAASRDMYLRSGKFDPSLSQASLLAVGVPGILALYGKALELAGSKSFSELISPSIEVAEQGFGLDEYYVSRYNKAVEELNKDAASAEVYFRSDGSHLKVGDVLKQPDLARTYKRLEQEGVDYFYHGDFAERLTEYMNESGGLITVDDMANYSAKLREPIIGTYHGCEIIGMPPPSSGGVHITQILNMLEASSILEGKNDWDVGAISWTARFMRKAFEDRAAYLGDTDFYPVPVGRLTSKDYGESCVKAIMGETPSFVESRSESGLALGHTTNICVIDRWGNAVAINQTVNLTFGAKITLPGTGVILNNEMDDFSAQPGVPNAFGLIGSEANAIAPGKRPLSSMSPTIVVRGDKPILILGGAGGPTIITAVLQTIIDVLDFNQELSTAMAQPRFHHQFKPDVLVMEHEMSTWTMLRLLLKGQVSVRRPELGRVNAIAWSDSRQMYIGMPDPRGGGGAVAH